MTRNRTTLLIGIVVLGLAIPAGWWFGFRRSKNGQSSVAPTVDPRLTYTGPFRNVHPDVKYVPERRCAECHQEIAQSFARHPMGRSLLPLNEGTSPPEDSRHNNPFDAMGSRFTVAHQGGKVTHRRGRPDAFARPEFEMSWAADYQIGSGTLGYSYISNKDGFLFQTPISWYSQKQTWDLSPGFGQTALAGRPVVPECLFCHANRVNHAEGSVNRYAEPIFEGHSIGCQRCHGPGELHVAARLKREPVSENADHTIVNPRHLEWPQREAVCEQCHLEGEIRILRRGRGLFDFRPGMPLEDFWSAFVHPPDSGEDRRAVGHTEQMYLSRCFQAGKSLDRMGCVSCHDPHEAVAPAERVSYYRDRCNQCHSDKKCSLPVETRLKQSQEDSCIQCHMPRYGSSDIPHTASTDHRIPRRPRTAGSTQPGVSRGHDLPIVSFYRDRVSIHEAEASRDLGVAFVNRSLLKGGHTQYHLQQILPMLETALVRDPNDEPAGEARGYALLLQHRTAEALAAFEAVLAHSPASEMTLVGAAMMAEQLRQTEAALRYWRSAVVVNPQSAGYRRNLVLLLVRREAWEEAMPNCEAWLRLDPMSVEARTAKVACLMAAGRKEAAQQEFARIEILAPPNLRDLQQWFAGQLR